MIKCRDLRLNVARSDRKLPDCDSWYQSMVETMLVRFLLPFVQTPIMFKKMTFAKCFDEIDVALKNLEGVVDAIRNIQNEEILELFRRVQE